MHQGMQHWRATLLGCSRRTGLLLLDCSSCTAAPQQGVAHTLLLPCWCSDEPGLVRSPGEAHLPAPTALAASMRCGSTSRLIILEVRPPESSSHATWGRKRGPHVCLHA